MESPPNETLVASNVVVSVSKERVAQFNALVSAKFNEQRGVENLPLKEILDHANKRTNGSFSTQEANACLSEMQDENKIMLADEMIFLI
jgi:PBP1b-binding outer membrane lipoprotein LpoB